MTEPNRLETTEPVTIFAIPEAKRESTLRAINAINDLGGDIFTVPSKADAAGTTSGTMCTFSSARGRHERLRVHRLRHLSTTGT